VGKIQIRVGVCYIRRPVHMVSFDCTLTPPLSKNHKSHQVQKMPTVEELLAWKAQADAEFQALIVEAQKKEVEEKERAE